MSARAPTGTTAYIAQLRGLVDRALEGLELPSHPATLYDPVRYALGGDGKRLRPILLLIASEGYGVPVEDALSAALAVEVFHNFTLVHDDIMDHASARRGRATLHTEWDEGTAILSGDYMMALSYRLLAHSAREHLHEVFPVFDEMVSELCEGQALDKAFESIESIGVADYTKMIDSKTGALMRASLEIGGMLGRASPGERDLLRRLGIHVGRAFQIQDDLLDLVAEDARWGKAVGGDLLEGKKTFLLLSALESRSEQDAAWFRALVARGGASVDEVTEARSRMERMGVLERARSAVDYETEEAAAVVAGLDVTDRVRAALRSLVDRLKSRVH